MTVHLAISTSKVQPRRYQSPRRRYRHGRRAAAVRALTGARLYLAGEVPTLSAAADAVGSCVAYVAAALILLRANNASLVQSVIAGRKQIVQAAGEAKRLANLITAYQEAEDSDRIAFARAAGLEAIFDVLVKAS